MNTEFRNKIVCADARSYLRSLPESSVDAIVTDPPYPEINRNYGRLSEPEWFDLMQACVIEFRRILKPSGSAIMVLQPNSEMVGKMRLWFWKFMVWCGEYWNIVQDVYWWNFSAPPTVHTHRDIGLMRPSVKPLIWIGPANCYRNQGDVLWTPSKSVMALDVEDRALHRFPSGNTSRNGRIKEAVLDRGGSTPFNLLPIANADSFGSAGALGHGAGTPAELVRWWIRYISKPGDLVLDPFIGSGTVAREAIKLAREYCGCDIQPGNVSIASDSLSNIQMGLAM